MPRRLTPLVNGEVYHVFNRGVNKQPIFNSKRDYSRAIEVLKYYMIPNLPIRYSRFIRLSLEERNILLKKVDKKEKLVDLISYCFMPNHFHFLFKQNIENGISKLMRNFQISYTRFINTKYDRIGPLLQGQFQAVHIEDDNQLFHVSRYIHLNPYTSYILKDTSELTFYPWSSFPEYLGLRDIEICSKLLILFNFADIEKYKEFVFNQADYQRKLEDIKHLILE